MSDRKNLLLISICVMIVSLPALVNEFVFSADNIFHLSRIISIAEELPKFPVQIYSSWLWDLGSPTGIFYPSLFLYPFALLFKFGVPLHIVYNSFFVFTITMTAICAFVAGNMFFKDRIMSTIFAVIYISAWYFQINLYARGDFGEALGSAFLPLALISSRCMLNKNSWGRGNQWLIAVIAYTGLIQSHILTTLMFCMILLAFWVFEMIRNRSLDVLNWKIFGKILISTIAVNAFFIIPFLQLYFTTEINISNGAFLSNDTRTFFKIFNIFRHAAIIAIPFLIVMIFQIHRKQTKYPKTFIVSLSIGILSCLTNWENFPWKHIEAIPMIGSVFEKFQWPCRFMIVSELFFSIALAISIFETCRLFKSFNKIFPAICLIFATYSISLGGHIDFIEKPQYHGWFFARRVTLSDDFRSAVIDLRSLTPWENLNSWKDSRVESIKIENGALKIAYNSSENFSREIPISYYDSVLARDEYMNELSSRREGWMGLVIDFPAGSGVVTVNIPRIDSMYDDYAPRGFYREEIRRGIEIYNSGFEPRVLKIDRHDGKIFVEYDLSKAGSNLEGNSKIELPIFYFPGHAANVPIESSERHLIQIDPSNLESHGTIEIFYEGLPSFKIANIISLATLIFLLVKIRREGF